MSITKAKADDYFDKENHPRASVWEGFSNYERTGAMAHAKRVISRYLNCSLDEEDTVDGDFPRHDLAVYEQAIWSLENSPLVRDARSEAPEATATDPEADGGAREASADILAPEARRWLTRGGTVMIGRG